jgi:hypothetical protein
MTHDSAPKKGILQPRDYNRWNDLWGHNSKQAEQLLSSAYKDKTNTIRSKVQRAFRLLPLVNPVVPPKWFADRVLVQELFRRLFAHYESELNQGRLSAITVEEIYREITRCTRIGKPLVL